MKEQKLEALGDDKGEQVLGRSKLSGKKKEIISKLCKGKKKNHIFALLACFGTASITICFNHRHFLGVDGSFCNLGLQIFLHRCSSAFELSISSLFFK